MVAVIEKVRHCRYCDRDMTEKVSALSYAENPFCQDCLEERVSKSPGAPANETAVLVGKYFYFIQE